MRCLVREGPARNLAQLRRADPARQAQLPLSVPAPIWRARSKSNQPSYLFLAVEEGHEEVERALLEVGGRELVMMIRNDGISCIYISAQKGHLDVLKVMLEAGGRELPMLAMEIQLPLHKCAGGSTQRERERERERSFIDNQEVNEGRQVQRPVKRDLRHSQKRPTPCRVTPRERELGLRNCRVCVCVCVCVCVHAFKHA
jgi:hypothetical protein